MRIELITEFSGERVIGLAGVKSLADNGNIEALNVLGEWMLMGYECSPDVDFAFKCFKKAAKKGNTQAMLNLGICYMNGYGVDEDFYVAERWIRAAHECGDEEAMAVCEQLYSTTIGGHKPDLKTYVDLVYDQMSNGTKNKNEFQIKEMLLKQMILSASGVSEDDFGSVWSKVTENDIVAFETMNDINYGRPVKKTKKIEKHIDKKQYCKMLEAEISEKTENELTDFIALLYNLCDPKDKSFKEKIKSIKYCQYTDLKKIPWVLKALYEVEKGLYGKFNAEDLKDIVNEILKREEEIDNEKIEKLFKQTKNQEKELIKLRNKLRNSSEYTNKIKRLWINNVSQTIIELQNNEIEDVMSDDDITCEDLLKIFQKVSEKEYEYDVLALWENKVNEKYSELEEKEIEQKFDTSFNDYFGLLNFFDLFKTEVYRKNIKTKWEPQVKKRLCELQREELEKICSDLESRSYEKLKNMLSEQIVKYSFDKEILELYRKKITERIDFLETQELEELCKNTDEFSIKDFTELIELINSLNYGSEKKQPYISHMEQKKENLIILEDCTVDNLEKYDLNRLNEKISAVHFSTLDSQTKEELTQRVNSYINLFLEGKDKFSNQIREKCSPEKVEKLTDSGYAELIKEVNASRILTKEKNEIVSRLKEQRKHKFLIPYEQERLLVYSFEKLKELEKQLEKTEAVSDKDKIEIQEKIENQYKHLNKLKFSAECSKNKLAAMKYTKLKNLIKEIEDACLDDKQKYVDFVEKHIELYNECEKQCAEIYKGIADEVVRKADVAMKSDPFAVTYYKSIEGFYERTQEEFLWCIEKKSFKEKGLFEKVTSKGLALINSISFIYVLTLDGFVILNRDGVQEISYNWIDKIKPSFFNEEIILSRNDWLKETRLTITASRSDRKQLIDYFNELKNMSARSTLEFKKEYRQCEEIKKQFFEKRKEIGTDCDNQPINAEAATDVVKPEIPDVQSAQQVSAIATQTTKTETKSVSPQIPKQQVIADLVEVLKGVSETKPTTVQSEERSIVTEQPVDNKTKFLEYGNKLEIGHLLDFENVSTSDYLKRYPGFSSIKGIEPGEFGVVLIKNFPTDILITNTSILWQFNDGKTFYHVHPKLDKLNSISLKGGKITDSIAMSDCTVCDNYDAKTNESILAFLKYVAFGIETDIKNSSQQVGIEETQVQQKTFVEGVDDSKNIEAQLAQLKRKYNSFTEYEYLVSGEASFVKKLPKAKAAYANVTFSEKPLVMEDATIFGSAKTGFVLTDKHVFIKLSDEEKKIIPVESVTDVVKKTTLTSNFYRIKLASNSGEYTLTSVTGEVKSQKIVEFFRDVFELIKRNVEKQSALNSASAEKPKNETTEIWKCSCGNECKGNFCNQCGKPRNK